MNVKTTLASKSRVATLISYIVSALHPYFNVQVAVAQNETSADAKNSVDPIELKLALRDLWVDHIVWTRNYIISFVADLPDADPVAQRLLKN